MLKIDTRLIEARVNVAVIGAGGTGSHMAANLAVLHQTMLDMGHPCGLGVTIYDDDMVSEANVGRSSFYECDVGMNKAIVLANRINVCFGQSFGAVPYRLSEGSGALDGMDVVIGCVDSRAGRREIWRCLSDSRSAWKKKLWLDCGNGEKDGVCILGEVGGERSGVLRAPTVIDLYPEMLDEEKDPQDDGPSCSRAEALMKQGAFVNKTAALLGVNMLTTLLTKGSLKYSAVYFDVESGKTSTVEATPQAWARFGYGEEGSDASGLI